MRFDLDEQQRAFQNAVAEYLTAECPPERALAPHESGAADFGVWRGLMELGLGGMMVPEEYGGLGLGLLDLAAVAEPIGRYAAPGPFLEHALATLAIVLGGSEAQRDAWLPALASGEKRATIALAEYKGEWLAGQWSLSAGKTLTGAKRFVLHGDGADLIVVGVAGGRFALVEPGRGVTLTPVPSTDGGKRLATLTLEDAPCELLPEAVGGRVVDAGLVLLAADAFGGGSRLVEMSLAYAKEREQFGQPIGGFQAMKHQLADMALMVEPTIGLWWYAAHAFDSGDAPAASQAAAIAKAHIGEVFAQVSRQAIEAHGGIGYTWEYPAHVWLKRALFDQAFLGSPHAHRARVADMAGW